MNPSFNILAPNIYTGSATLFIEAGPTGISFVVLNTGDCFQAVVTYSFPNRMNPAEIQEEMEEILRTEPLLQKPFSKTHLIWTYPESILVPPELYDREQSKDMLELVFGDLVQGSIFHDFLYRHNLYNTHRIPDSIRRIFEERIPVSTQRHQYSLLIDRARQEGNELFLCFYSGSFTLMLCKDGNLQIIRNVIYNTPEDVAYYLLDTCRCFEIAPDSVKLSLSGMIDKKSNLYAAVYKYFLHIEFAELPPHHAVAEEIRAHPPHFFSHLFYQALCV